MTLPGWRGYTMQEVLEDGLHARVVTGRVKRDDNRLADLTRLGQEIEAEWEKVPGYCGQWVCLTHWRFAPCRTAKTNCSYSCQAADVETVRRYQQS